ncbi:hypothetical protein RF11_03227 [Thelohanellus kitauei]|uniref:PH domain-containing protein n=1 Tax=Thelohanellus kitauei TaxID=669202 RepID=A0A0C2MR59_THEKT|nr:hypothetical protein RF11_03227 [Thelohanellus kitauei]
MVLHSKCKKTIEHMLFCLSIMFCYSFSHLQTPLYKQIILTDDFDDQNNFQHMPIALDVSKERVVHSGYMDVYPPLIESTEVEKWLASTKSKSRYFVLYQEKSETGCRLTYRKDENDSSEFEIAVNVESCAGLKKTPNLKSNTFQLQINEKTFIFVVAKSSEYDTWVKAISDVFEVHFECSESKTSSGFKKNINIRETYNLYDVYPALLSVPDITPKVTYRSFLPGDPIGEQIVFEPIGFNLNFECVQSIIVIFAVFDIRNYVKLTEDFVYEFKNGTSRDVEISEKKQYHEVVTLYGKKLAYSLSNAYVFSIKQTNESIYLVGRFYQNYTSGFNDYWDDNFKFLSKKDTNP